MDDEYLEASDVGVIFVKTPQTSIPSEFPTTKMFFTETEGLDKEEDYPLEFDVEQ